MKTTYFWKAAHEPEPDGRYISISRTKPPMTGMASYEPLMPSWDIIRLAKDKGYSEECLREYKLRYFEQLERLDAKEVYEMLKDYTIACFESSKDIASGKKFCHRRMVAGWIETELGIAVPEETRMSESGLIVPAMFNNGGY